MATMPTTVTNFATNPRPLTGLDTGAGVWEYVAGVGEAGTSAMVASAGPVGLPGIARRTITTAKTSGPSGWRYSEASSGGPGTERAISLYVNPPAAANVILRLEYLVGGVTSGGTVDAPAALCPPGVWTELNVEGAATDSFNELRAWAFTTGVLPAGTFDASCGLLLFGISTPSDVLYPSAFTFPSDTTYPEA